MLLAKNMYCMNTNSRNNYLAKYVSRYFETLVVLKGPQKHKVQKMTQ